MARATSVDSTWTGELDSGVSIGGTSFVLDTTSGTNWPSGSGIFGVQVGEDPDDDAELLQVTRSGATLTLDASTPTFTKNHSAGAPVYYLTTAPDINAKSDTGHTHAQSDVTNLTTDLAAKLPLAGGTMTAPILMANGSAGAPSVARSAQTNTGVFFSGSQVSVSTAGTERFRVTAATIQMLLATLVNAPLQFGNANIGASLLMSGTTTPPFLTVTQASCVLILDQRTWSTGAGFYLIHDPLGVLTDLTIYAFDDTTGIYNDINGADPTYGTWSDISTTSTGPNGDAFVLTQAGGLWLLQGSRTDTGSGAAGGWTIRRLQSGFAP